MIILLHFILFLMEWKVTSLPVYSKETQEVLDNAKETREKLLKQIGDYIITTADFCFKNCNKDKTQSISSKCIKNCQFNLLKSNDILVQKYYNLNKYDFTYERSLEYFDSDELIEVLKETKENI